MTLTIQSIKNILLGIIVSIYASQAVFSQAYPVQITNGQVTAMALNTTTGVMYMGGLFTHLNVSVTGSFVPINESDGHPEAGWPNIGNDVNIAVPDGAGGWFIGGDIYQVGGILRNNLAHINAAKQVTSWNPNANFDVEAMVLVGNTLYVAGGFTSIGGVTRRGLAAIDAITGSVTGFNADPTNYGGQITTMAVSGSTLFVGGTNLTTIMGVPRKYLAAIDLNTGSVTGWNPNPNNYVFGLTVHNNTLYVGGSFTTITGIARRNAAAFDISTGNVTAWDPDPNGAVRAIAAYGDRIYLAGSFGGVRSSSVNYQIRYNGLAAVTEDLGTAIGDWSASSYQQFDNWGIYTLDVNENGVYTGGRFKKFNGIDRNGLAAFSLTNGTLLDWNPNTNKKNAGTDRFIWIHTLSMSDNKVFVGGDFETVGGQPRKSLAAIDINTGKETSWNPTADSYTEKITLSGNTIYVGGDFTTIGGITRNHLAALDAVSGSVTGWNPNANAMVKGIEVIGNNVYVGGQFTSISGVSRNRLAAIDATTGLATAWYPSTSGSMEIRTLKSHNGALYVGGEFSTIGGMPRSNLAAIDIASGSITGWAPNSYPYNGRINTIDISGNTVYIGGGFTTISGVKRNRIAAVDAVTGVATNWNPDANEQVFEILVKNDLVYATGYFQRIGTPIRRYLAAMDATTGQLTNWNPSPTSTNVISSMRIIANGDKVYIAGNEGTGTISGNLFATTNDYLVGLEGSGPANAILVTSATISGTGGVSTISSNGGTLQMISMYAPANATNTNIVLSASPASVATISSSGLLSAVGNGLVTVTGAYGSVSAYKVITVSGQLQSIPVTSATVSGIGNISTVGIGGTLQMIYSYSPANANVYTTPTWSSSNTILASINSISGVLSGIAEGTVTVTGTFGSVTGSALITIIPAVSVTGVSVTPASATVPKGSTIQLTATVSPLTATNKTLTWSSDNSSIASVNNVGLVSGINEGTTTITVSTQDGGFTASSIISVSGVLLGITDDYKTETLNFYPNPASQLVKLSVSSWSDLQIYDATGLSVSEKVLVIDSYLDVKSLTPGLYFIRVFSKSGKMLTGKLQVGPLSVH